MEVRQNVLLTGLCSPLVPQIVGTAAVLAVSLALGTLSLLGLSQAGRGERTYQVLDRASLTGVAEPLRPPGGPEDAGQQQQHVESLLDSGETADVCRSLYVCSIVTFLCRCCYSWV